MLCGIASCGDRVQRLTERDYDGSPQADVAVFYGLAGKLARIIKDYPAAGKTAVYVDLGYWERRSGGRFRGYHKIAVNGRHPTAYFQNRRHDDARAKALGVAAKPWKKEGSSILIAGMGTKAAEAEGLGPLQFECEVIETLKSVSDRPIIYRPKPNCPDAAPIKGVEYSPAHEPLSEALADCHAVVTHHSNVAVDGLIAGIPAFCLQGVATVLALRDLSAIEAPLYPDGRDQFINDVSYCQWSVSEMERGDAWRHLKDEGLVP